MALKKRSVWLAGCLLAFSGAAWADTIAQLEFQAAGQAGPSLPAAPTANQAVAPGADAEILWSKKFTMPSFENSGFLQRADIRQYYETVIRQKFEAASFQARKMYSNADEMCIKADKIEEVRP